MLQGFTFVPVRRGGPACCRCRYKWFLRGTFKIKCENFQIDVDLNNGKLVKGWHQKNYISVYSSSTSSCLSFTPIWWHSACSIPLFIYWFIGNPLRVILYIYSWKQAWHHRKTFNDGCENSPMDQETFLFNYLIVRCGRSLRGWKMAPTQRYSETGEQQSVQHVEYLHR